MPEKSIFLREGERGLIVGQSGSGKTAGAIWQLTQTAIAPVIVFDTKGEPAFDALPREHDGRREEMLQVASHQEFAALDHDDLPEYVLVRPDVDELASPAALDRYLRTVYDKFAPAFVYVDEAYQFHERGTAGVGLVALLTRGRSKGITTLIGTQRPAWVSLFALSEAVRFYVYALTLRADRKRLGEFIPDFEELPAFDHHAFLYYRVGASDPEMFGPVPLVKPLPALPALPLPGRSWF